MALQAVLVSLALPIAAAVPQLPCDNFEAAGTPCVAAHSLVRALFQAYSGSLYQVNRTRDGATLDVGVIAPVGNANAAAQDSFCGAGEQPRERAA
jgi:hypothetical protein